MGTDSKIEWTHHTFNPWRGCTKVSVGCANCYAEQLSGRNPRALGVWGPRGTRVVAAESYWRQPLAWEREAVEAGERRRVFCASLADVFEGRESMPAASLPGVRAARVRLFDLIRKTPHLDWLLLTKRPQNWREVIEQTLILAQAGDPDDKAWFEKDGDSFPEGDLAYWLNAWTGDEPPANVWLGTSVEDQAAADERIPHLLRCPAAVRFISAEPLLGAVDLRTWLTRLRRGDLNGAGAEVLTDLYHTPRESGIHLVIVGGESGPKARPSHPDWSRSLRDQCQAAGVSFFFKQWGGWEPVTPLYAGHDDSAENGRGDLEMVDRQGRIWGDRDGQPNDPRTWLMERVGKKAAGRLLDGREWNEMPFAAAGAHRRCSREVSSAP